MPNLREIQTEAAAVGSGHDVVRRKYIKALSELTERNVIVYYSAWLQKPILQLMPHMQVNDTDKNGFMATIHQLDRKRGLDLFLHTPGGETAATESLVHYLRQMFDTDIRAFVPQLAMSAGTMIALACKEIIMGKHSNLGPIDPQIGTMPAHGVIQEFDRARDEIVNAKTPQERGAQIARWQPIIAKYSPTLIGECQQAMTWSNDMVTKWLTAGMFQGDPSADEKAKKIIDELGSHTATMSHARHIHMDRLRELGAKVIPLEEKIGGKDLQDAVLTVHHACINTLMQTHVIKLIENQNSISFMIAAQMQLPPQQPSP